MLTIGIIIGLLVGLLFSILPIRIYKAMSESYNDLYDKYINLRAEMHHYQPKQKDDENTKN